MLSSLPKLADRSFIIGFLVPSVLFLMGIYLVFYDSKTVTDWVAKAFAKDALESFVFAAVAAWLFAILLSVLNHPLLQIVEGYRFPVSKFAGLQRRSHAAYDCVVTELERRADDWRKHGDDYPIEKQAAHDELLAYRVTHFPSERRFVLPTRLGNVIRAFEEYSRSVYGADSIPLWNHLSGVLPKSLAQELSDARTEINCLVNIVVLSFVIAVLSLLRAFLALPWHASPSFEWLQVTSVYYFVAIGASAMVISRGTYELSIDRAIAWGSLVKSAFDCCLPRLAETLGYRLPETSQSRKDFWQEVSRQAIYHRPIDIDRWEKAGGAGVGAAEGADPGQCSPTV